MTDDEWMDRSVDRQFTLFAADDVVCLLPQQGKLFPFFSVDFSNLISSMLQVKVTTKPPETRLIM